MINGDEVRVVPELNKFVVYRMGSHGVQVFYYRQSNQAPRILDLPKCLIELVPSKYEPTIKEVRTRVMKHAREDGKGWGYDRVRAELIKENEGGGTGPEA